MYGTHRRATLGALLVSSLLAACASDAAPDAPDVEISQVVEAIGASRVHGVRIDAHGTRFEPFQGLRPEDSPIVTSTFEFTGTYDFHDERVRLSWQRELFDPLRGALAYDEIIVDDAGFIAGVDLVFGFGQDRPMTADRVVAVRRLQRLLHPHLLLRTALREGRAIRYIGRERRDGGLHHVVAIDAVPRPIHLFIAARRHRITRVATVESDPLLGDVEVAVDLADWRAVSGARRVAFPHDVTLRWNGQVLHHEIRDHIQVNPDLDDDLFALPATLPFDPVAAANGATHAQWVNRALALGAPLFLDPGEVVAAPIAPDVVLMTGGVHHTLAIALDSGVVLVEPPLHEARSLAVIAKVAELWPDKPISHMIVTHYHYDHSGGIRTYAALGATLVVAEGDRPFFEQVLARPHDVAPDLLAGSEAVAEFLTVADQVARLGDDDTAIEIHRIPSPHAAENLVVYLPGDKLLFNSDLYNPGFFPPEVLPAPPFDVFAVDLRAQLERLGLDVEWLVGGHGAAESRPYSELIGHTGG